MVVPGRDIPKGTTLGSRTNTRDPEKEPETSDHGRDNLNHPQTVLWFRIGPGICLQSVNIRSRDTPTVVGVNYLPVRFNFLNGL